MTPIKIEEGFTIPIATLAGFIEGGLTDYLSLIMMEKPQLYVFKQEIFKNIKEIIKIGVEYALLYKSSLC